MKQDILLLYSKCVAWNKIHGIAQTIEGQRKLTQAEWTEYRKAKSHEEMKKESADVFFTSAYLHYLCKEAGKEYYTSYDDACRLVDLQDAWHYVDAVISSNYTKYVPAYSAVDMRVMALVAKQVADQYKGRYTQVVAKHENGFYFITGVENGTEKVLKPAGYFKSIDEFLTT